MYASGQGWRGAPGPAPARTLTFASAVAAMKCQEIGIRRGIPRLPEAPEFLRAHGQQEIAAALT